MQQDTARSLTPRTMIQQLESGDIGNEIRIPRAMALNHPALAAEISLFAAEPVGKCKGVIENEIQITKPVNHHRCVCKRNKSRRLISLDVKMLAPSVEGR